MPKKKLPYYDRKGYAYVYVNRQPVSLKAPNGRRCKKGRWVECLYCSPNPKPKSSFNLAPTSQK